VSAEELTSKNTAEITRSAKPDTSEGEYDDSQRMTDPQANFIDVKAKQLNVNVPEMFKKVFNIGVGKRVIKKQASQAIEKLNEYQQGGVIPSEILGYQEWRS
jgi:phosphoribosylaminoimidazole (AIR) synthetase